MEIAIWLIFTIFTLFIFITLALVNCADLPEDPSTENKRSLSPTLKAEKAHAAHTSKQRVPPCAAANAPNAHGKAAPVKKSVKYVKKQKTLPKASGGHSQPTLAVAKSQRSLASQTKSKVSRGKSTVSQGPSHQLPVAETKTTSKLTVSSKSTASVKEEDPKVTGNKPGAKLGQSKPKLPYYPELGPLLVDQQLYEKLKKKYDLSTAPPSTTEGKSSSTSRVRSTASDGSSQLSRFKTQSFGGSLSKCSTKLDSSSAIDGATVDKSKKLVKEAKQPEQQQQ